MTFPTGDNEIKRGRIQWASTAALLFGVVLVGFFLRIDDLRHWRRYPERAFHEGRPVLLTYDGYYYLRLAAELNERRCAETDELRAVPENMPRPSPPSAVTLSSFGETRRRHHVPARVRKPSSHP